MDKTTTWKESPEYLLLVKKEKVKNDMPALMRNAANEYAGYKYVDLDAILPELKRHMKEHGLAMRFEYNGDRTQMDAKLALWLIIVDMETGYQEKNLFEFPVTACQTDPIKRWKATWTYSRRAALEIVFDLTSDEDPDSMADARQGRQQPQGKSIPPQRQQAQQAPAQQAQPPAQEPTPQPPAQKDKLPTVTYGGKQFNENSILEAGARELNDNNTVPMIHFVFSVASGLYKSLSEMPPQIKEVVEKTIGLCNDKVMTPDISDTYNSLDAVQKAMYDDIVKFYNGFCRK